MDISKLNLNGKLVNLKDNTARTDIENINDTLNSSELKDGSMIAWDSINGKFISSQIELSDSDFDEIFK